ncbi:phosphoribosylformylglycinamidine synthase isoform X1 [Hydra vulgaris]|uniref:phosphoribosylformylglycinamidine synthase isoform X1 n=1 Tax=Hydra vulgaris TaxID=6087 RepID=UPI001F5ED983|nr:phosphoribosylformylglycinamidine synthase [Hydra vulgaris]
MEVLHLFKSPGLNESFSQLLVKKIEQSLPYFKFNIKTEVCFNIGYTRDIECNELAQLKWLLANSFEEHNVSDTSNLLIENGFFIEVGPRLNFATPFSTNAVSICHSIGLNNIKRIEMSRCYVFEINCSNKESLSTLEFNKIKNIVENFLYDKMTEMPYISKLKSFTVNEKPNEVYEIDILGKGKAALETANVDLGLAFDEWDLNYYTQLFQEKVCRNPTNVECFDLGQSNSEHSRHWFFKGKIIFDGKEKEKCLMDMVCGTQLFSNNNNVIKFSDNSSAIEGFVVRVLVPKVCFEVGEYIEKEKLRHIIFTAETHNFPTGVAPFPGATTGTGGRIRDVQATGRGAHVIAGTAGYCFGNLKIPGYELPWENDYKYPTNFALPLQICIEASNGASDYGNKFGEPLIAGFARSFAMDLYDGERYEWIKPIMFSGGIGSIESNHVIKSKASVGMQVVKVGGPVYRIGVGGGAASSIHVQGDNSLQLDFNAVQRGDPEMEQKMNRVIRSCIEMDENNPIKSIHDQGAGGNGNVLKEICDPAGAIIRAKDFELGDPTLSLMEIWGAEYQESNALLIESKDISILKKIAQREKVSVCVVGEITGDGRVVLQSNEEPSDKNTIQKDPFDLPLDIVLGKMPQKIFEVTSIEKILSPLILPEGIDLLSALERVLRLPSVASKRYLTNKVDRSVTGLIAQQQCVGPLHTPLADVAIIALSHFDVAGSATSIGEQPVKMFIDPKKGARLTVAEAFTNLVFAKISDIKDIKCSANWMWPAKLPGEGSRIYEACEAMCDMLSSLGVAVDGGKDSLSMAARVESKVVKAPGSLVVSLYAPCPDVRKKVTPDFKVSGNEILFLKMNEISKWRVGGSALAQVFRQIGNDSPDISDFQMFSQAFIATQALIGQSLIVSGHDISDGGLITSLLEMAFAGDLSFNVELESIITSNDKLLDILFAEEPSLLLEVQSNHTSDVIHFYKSVNIECVKIGHITSCKNVVISLSGNEVLNHDMKNLRDIWEATSFQLERLQSNPFCVEEEERTLKLRHTPCYTLSFNPDEYRLTINEQKKPNVAVLREEGSNGDREMASAFHMAGFNVYDVTMQELCDGKITLDIFKGIVFVGGFSYADVFGSAKGWASILKFNDRAKHELEVFRKRSDTFSLGVCNGCQLMALLGWVGKINTDENAFPEQGVCFTTNSSGRFESRFVNVKIVKSSSLMLAGMEGSLLGIWVSHGEGKLNCLNDDVFQNNNKNNIPILYADDDGFATTKYPYNPNGSPNGIAAICSSDGRHLAMMPHPERCTVMWQWPWALQQWYGFNKSPWLRMFYNAYDWCVSNKNI